MKNWKSTLAWAVFMGVYIYTIQMAELNPDVIETAGYIALISSVFMMFRADFTKEAINKLIENIKIGK